MERPDLPRFKNPPVVETAIGVFFHRIDGLTSAHQGIFWQQYLRKDFPKIEEHGAIPDGPSSSGLTPPDRPNQQAADAGPKLRLWAFSEDRTRLLQIQNDALLYNWLRSDASSHYPHYPQRKEELFRSLESFQAFVTQEDLGRITPTNCLVTYVNHLELSEPCEVNAELARIFAFWEHGGLRNIGEVTHSQLHLGFAFGKKNGRLYATISPAIRKADGRRVLILEITARHDVPEDTIEAPSAILDLCHEAAVHAFASMTREEMHQLWERVV